MIVAIIIGGFFIFLLFMGVRAQFKKKVSGREGLVGEIGVAKTDIKPSGGTVLIHGEYWNAVSDAPIKKNQKVRVIRIEEMVLHVELVKSQ